MFVFKRGATNAADLILYRESLVNFNSDVFNRRFEGDTATSDVFNRRFEGDTATSDVFNRRFEGDTATSAVFNRRFEGDTATSDACRDEVTRQQASCDVHS